MFEICIILHEIYWIKSKPDKGIMKLGPAHLLIQHLWEELLTISMFVIMSSGSKVSSSSAPVKRTQLYIKQVYEKVFYLKNYLPWYFKDWDYLPSCTSSGSILQLCKVSSISFNLFRKSCAYKTTGQADGQGDTYIPFKTCLKFHHACLIDLVMISCFKCNG